MKPLVIFSFVLFGAFAVAHAQQQTLIRAGYGQARAGTGDIPGSIFLLGAQKELSEQEVVELLLSGTYIERTTHFGQGYKLHEKSNGIALELTYNPTIKIWRFRLYPAVGPVLRIADERNIRQVGILYDQGRIVNFRYDVEDDKEMQLGYGLALNLDGRISKNISLGLRAAMQKFYNGKQLASLGVTIKNIRWQF